MQTIIDLPGYKLPLYYTKKVYSPVFTSTDTVVVADRLIKEAKGQIESVHDVGCGAGTLGLSLKLLHPELEVGLSDVSSEARRISKINAHKNHLDVNIFRSDLLKNVERVDMVVANLPTFDQNQMDMALHGPPGAYFADKTNGLHLYEELFSQARSRCLVLVLECQKLHQKRLLELAKDQFKLILRTDFAFAFIAEG